MELTPFIISAALGFVASVITRRAVVRFMAWYLIPLIVAVLTIGPGNFEVSGESIMSWFFFFYLLLLGLVASGVGTLIGYFLRRAFIRET